ncbi:MAG TPA: hypothetical protein VGK40_02090 [Verrucomicrobiae bacterium]|jgi:hypothetical protein
MRRKIFLGLAAALCLSARLLSAQEATEVEALKKQLKQATESFEKALQEHRQIIESLNKRLDALQTQQAAVTNEQQKLRQLVAAPAADAGKPAPAAAVPWSPSQPITLARAGSAYMNVSFDALMDAGWSTARDPSARLQLGDHDPQQRGFSLRNAEIGLDGAVDPFFKGFANIVFKLERDQSTTVEVEEVFAQSTSLPANLQAKAGQFFANFGRQNPQHPHQWAFVDSPLILTRAFGSDGLRNIGGQLSWLLPTPFYSEAFLGVFNGQGGTAHSFRNTGEDDGTGTSRFHGRATIDRDLRGPGDLLFVPRFATSFELTDHQTVVAGASAAFGPNDTGAKSRTEIYGVDLYWKWKPSNAHEGFPFVSWQSEALYRRFGAGADPLAPTPLPGETLRDWGLYSQILWGFKPRWVAGLRGEYVNGNTGAFDANDIFRGQRTRVSPGLTWYPSEFSKLRLQYNYDHGEVFSDEHSVWLQLEFQLGAHAAHKF